MPDDSRRSSCFVISPMTQLNPARELTEVFFADVIRPALEEIGYRVNRVAPEDDEWVSSSRLARDIEDADFVLAVLTGLEPNAFFKMGLASAYCKPVVPLAEAGTPLPFPSDHAFFYPKLGEDRTPSTDWGATRRQLSAHVQNFRQEKTSAPLRDVMSEIGGRYSLRTVYEGKDWILRVFHSAISEALAALDKDYELAEQKRPEALKGVVVLLNDPARIFYEQCRALHQAVHAADLGKAERKSCLEICEAMLRLCDQVMALPARVTQKVSFNTEDIALARAQIEAMLSEIEAVLSQIARGLEEPT